MGHSLKISARPPEAIRSQTSLAYERLRRDILAGRLAPGEKLKIADLAITLGVSPGAIRESLSRLLPEKLVISRDQKGFVVTPLSIADLEDLTDFRCEIEEVALRRSVARGGIAWEAGVVAAAHRLRGTPQRISSEDPSLSDDWVDQHAAFHAALVSACGSERLLDFHAQLYEQSERYRGLSVHVESDRDVAREHQDIVDAALAHDADKLVCLVLQHLRTTTVLIVERSKLG